MDTSIPNIQSINPRPPVRASEASPSRSVSDPAREADAVRMTGAAEVTASRQASREGAGQAARQAAVRAEQAAHRAVGKSESLALLRELEAMIQEVSAKDRLIRLLESSGIRDSGADVPSGGAGAQLDIDAAREAARQLREAIDRAPAQAAASSNASPARTLDLLSSGR